MDQESIHILLIDDDETQLALIKTMAESIDTIKVHLDTETDPVNAIEKLHNQQYDLIITDYYMSGLSGLEVLEKVKSYSPHIPVAIITSETKPDVIIEVMKKGAYDFILKPVSFGFFHSLVSRIYDRSNLEKEVTQLRQRIHAEFSIDSIIGKSPPIRQLIETIGRISDHSVNVLIRGESGSGKELVANALHYTSPRRDGPFVIVNIAALSESLIESELFGHSRGAFTGADKDRIGRFEEADKGTLFIDEIGDVSPAIQVKLLRAIQFKQFQRIGENKDRTSDVRIIAATSRNLEEMMDKGDFRSDLFYRLNVVEITVPPLRDRREDIPLLADYFIQKQSETSGVQKKSISKEAMHSLITHDYPGNIRELQNAIEHSMVFSKGSQIISRDLPSYLQKKVLEEVSEPSIEGDGYEQKMNNFEFALLRNALEEANWNQSEAARLLKMTERRLRYRMEKLGIKEGK